jgi:hypothetical protein
MIVEGIKHDINADASSHIVTLQLTETTNVNPAVWKLGVSKLGIDTVLAYGPPPFDPTTISGCTLYLRSDLGVSLSGSYVTQWNDQSGNICHASASGTGPKYTANAINGYPALILPSLMTLAHDPFALNWTAFVVFQTQLGEFGPLITSRNAATTAFHRLSVDNSNLADIYDTDGTNHAGASNASTYAAGTYILSGSSAAGQPDIVYLNGDAGTSASAASPLTAFTTTNWELGGTTPGNAIYGAMVSFIVYSRVLTTAERQYVVNGLNTRYLIY